MNQRMNFQQRFKGKTAIMDKEGIEGIVKLKGVPIQHDNINDSSAVYDYSTLGDNTPTKHISHQRYSQSSDRQNTITIPRLYIPRNKGSVEQTNQYSIHNNTFRDFLEQQSNHHWDVGVSQSFMSMHNNNNNQYHPLPKHNVTEQNTQRTKVYTNIRSTMPAQKMHSQPSLGMSPSPSSSATTASSSNKNNMSAIFPPNNSNSNQQERLSNSLMLKHQQRLLVQQQQNNFDMFKVKQKESRLMNQLSQRMFQGQLESQQPTVSAQQQQSVPTNKSPLIGSHRPSYHSSSQFSDKSSNSQLNFTTPFKLSQNSVGGQQSYELVGSYSNQATQSPLQSRLTSLGNIEEQNRLKLPQIMQSQMSLLNSNQGDGYIMRPGAKSLSQVPSKSNFQGNNPKSSMIDFTGVGTPLSQRNNHTQKSILQTLVNASSLGKAGHPTGLNNNSLGSPMSMKSRQAPPPHGFRYELDLMEEKHRDIIEHLEKIREQRSKKN